MNNFLEIRKIPYPFQAMLTITNDCDATDFNTYMEMNNYFNTSNTTKYGNGLSLDIGNSFWFFQHPLANEPGFSYFEDLTKKQSRYASEIRNLIKAGHIDSLHTYGNFSTIGGFKREYAEIAANEIEKNNIHVPIWINHGDTFNKQNILSGDGDLSTSECYHMDITSQLKFKFYWCGDIRNIISQERPFKVDEIYFPEGQKVRVSKYLTTHIKIGIKKLMQIPIFTDENAIIKPVHLRDGEKIITFSRFGYWKTCSGNDLAFLLSKSNLRKLIDTSGISSVYVHLGKNFPGEFSKHTVNSLELLSHYSKQKVILVTTTANLLKYIIVKKYIKFKIKELSDKIQIILYFDNPYIKKLVTRPHWFRGLSFKVGSFSDYRVTYQDKKLPFILKINNKNNFYDLFYKW